MDLTSSLWWMDTLYKSALLWTWHPLWGGWTQFINQRYYGLDIFFVVDGHSL